jgi:hypothetical protein
MPGNNNLLCSLFRGLVAQPAVLVLSNVHCRIHKCPPKRFQRIVQGAGIGFLLGEDRTAKDFSCGVDCVWRFSGQVRPRPHPPDEYAAPPEPSAIEPCLDVSGPINRKSFDDRRFNRFDWTNQGLLAPEDTLVRLLEPSIVGGMV